MPHYIVDDRHGRIDVVKTTSVESFAAIFRRGAC